MNTIGNLFLLLFNLIVWAVVGFLIWVSILVRSAAMFALMSFSVTLTRTSHDALAKYASRLKRSITFYSEGFRNIINALDDKEDDATIGETKFTINWFHVIFEVIWALIFWYLTLVLFGVIYWVPWYSLYY